MAVLPQSRLSIITLGVRDRAAMTAFYRDTVGLKLIFDEGMTLFDMGGFALGLWSAEKLADDAGQMPGNPSPAGIFKGVALAYNARSRDEVDAIFSRLRAADVAVTKAPHEAFWGGYSGYFADPEGNAWEIAHNPFWTLDEAGRVEFPAPKEA